jgi:magnesium chelatase family protein
MRLGLASNLNSRLPGRLLRGDLAPDQAAADLLSEAVRRGTLSARAADRAVRVAWTISDREGTARPGVKQIGAALALRGLTGGSAS